MDSGLPQVSEYAFIDDHPERGELHYTLQRENEVFGLICESEPVEAETLPLRLLECFLEVAPRRLLDKRLIEMRLWPGAEQGGDLDGLVRDLRRLLDDVAPSRKTKHRLLQRAAKNGLRFCGRPLDGHSFRVQPAESTLPSLANTNEHTPTLAEPFADGLSADFTYRTRATTFVGRDFAMAALRSFLKDPRPGLWTLISGPAGTGKNRLAAELIAEIGGPNPSPGKWLAGFLLNEETWLRTSAIKWTAHFDTLIVIDYAGKFDQKDENRSALLNFLAHIRVSRSAASRKRIRVILIDRLPPESQESIVQRLPADSDRSGEIHAHYWKPRGAELVLGPVAEESAIAIVAEAAGETWTQDRAARVKQAIRADPELARPLFAFAIGDAIRARELPHGSLNPVTVTNVVYKRLLKCAHPEFLTEVKTLWAAATACQGVSEGELLDEESLHTLLGREWRGYNVPTLQARFRSLSGSTTETVEPLKPDFLGGLFVLQHLLALPAKLRLKEANSIMTVAWRYGLRTDSFISRLTSDFVTKLDQMADAAGRAEEDVKELLSQLVRSGISTEALHRGGPRAVALCAYLAARSEQPGIGLSFISALEDAYTVAPDQFAAELADGWFGLALSTDLPFVPPELAARASNRIEELFRFHDTKDTALVQAMALARATASEVDPAKCAALAERIGYIRQRHNTVDIAITHAQALCNTSAREVDASKSKKLASRIAKIWNEHRCLDIALLHASALLNACTSERDPTKCERLAERVRDIRRHYNTSEIALREARSIEWAARRETDPIECERLANLIREVQKDHNTAEIAWAHADALASATARETDPAGCQRLTKRIVDIWNEHCTVDVSSSLAIALANWSRYETDPVKSESLATAIGQIREQCISFDIGYLEVAALIRASTRQTDPVKCEAFADRIGDIRKGQDIGVIALLQALVLSCAIRCEVDPVKCDRLLGRIRDVALIHANLTSIPAQNEASLGGSGKRADDFRDTSKDHDPLLIVVAEVDTIEHVAVHEHNPVRCDALLHRTTEIRKHHYNLEMALAEASVIVKMMGHVTGRTKLLKLARRGVELLTVFGFSR